MLRNYKTPYCQPCSEHAIRTVQADGGRGVEIQLYHQLIVNAADDKLVEVFRKTRPSIASKEIGLEVNAEKMNYTVMPPDQNSR
jgi:hypothetical protein